MSYIKTIVLSLTCCILSACGGDGDKAPEVISGNEPVVVAPSINARPDANAGADQYVFVGTVVTLDGSASSDANGDVLAYKWNLLSKPVGSVASLSTGNNVRSVFTADLPGAYTASLVVNDGKIDSLAEVVTIIASVSGSDSGKGLIANGGPNQSIRVGTTANLDGALSSDAKGRPLSYHWTLLAKPVGSQASIADLSAQKIQLFADVPGLYSVSLVVSSGEERSLPVTVLVTATSAAVTTNIAPVANAGPDQSVSVGVVVALDGGLSSDPNGDILTYRWSFQSKPLLSTAVLSSATSKTPRFTADVVGTYEVALIVDDGKLKSQTDVINIVAKSAGVIEVPDTGLYKCGNLTKAQALALFAQGHTYLDRDHDGKPCEANDILNENSRPQTAPSNPGGNQCYVSGYYRKNGTYVKGYYRKC